MSKLYTELGLSIPLVVSQRADHHTSQFPRMEQLLKEAGLLHSSNPAFKDSHQQKLCYNLQPPSQEYIKIINDTLITLK